MNGGARYPGLQNIEPLIAFETALMKLQLQVEDSFLTVARSTNRPSVLIHDRAVLDVKAYMPVDVWEAVLKRNKWLEKDLAAR